MSRRSTEPVDLRSLPAQTGVERPTAQRWRAQHLLEAPHRLCFFWAGVMWALSAAWWAVQLLALWLGADWPWQVAPAVAHGLLFAMGSMPLFIAGFVFTAGPRWLHRPPVSAHSLRWPVWLYALGWVLAVAGFQRSGGLAACGLAIVTSAWAALTLRVLRLRDGSDVADRRHVTGIAAACLAIVACLAASSLALVAGHPEWLRSTLRIGLWSVVSIFLIASHRMLPFIGTGSSSRLDARWPDWPLWLVISTPLVQVVAAVLDPWQPASMAWSALQAAMLVFVAIVCLLWALRWRRQAALKQPLVAMLYVAFLWWDASLWLGAASHWPWMSASRSAALDIAHLHALALGFLGGTLLVMVSRVSSARSGRPQAIDKAAWLLYGTLQVTVVLRLTSALWTHAPALLLPLAACAWMGVAGLWAARHGRWLGRPRVDGRPG